MNTKRLTALFKRELRDILRDKKTIVMMVVVPIILYPLLIIGMAFLMSAIISGQEEKTYSVAFYKEPELSDKIAGILAGEGEDEFTYELKVVKLKGDDEASYREALNSGLINAYVRRDESGKYRICYMSANTDSETAAYGLKDVFSVLRDELRSERIEAEGLMVEEIFYPIEYETEDLSSTEESLGNRIGSFLPFFIITVILLGAIYPAIDVTAGERERGTLETLLTLPVTNFEMIMSKFLAVSVIASVTAFLNVISMGGAVAFLVMSSLNSMAELNISIDFKAFIPGMMFTVLTMICFALLVTAVCMCVCVFAHNFKEANNYITPVMLIFMFLSYTAVIPDFELNKITAAIPVVNVSLLVRELFKFNYDYVLFFIVLFSTVAYSLIAIRILAFIYNSEEILFNEGFRNMRLFDKRSDMKKGQMPGTGDVVMLLCVTLLLMFYIGNYAYMKFGVFGVFIQQLLILLMPLLFAWYMKADMKRLFMIKKPSVREMLGGVFLGFGAYMFAVILSSVLSPVFLKSLENTRALDDLINNSGFLVLLFVSAIMPAIGEELMFRGFTLNTLKVKYSVCISIVITSVLFAAYHLSIIRFFSLLPISFALTYSACKSKSIFVSMIMHFVNNSFSIIQAKFPGKIERLLPFLSEKELSWGSFGILIMLSVIFIIAGLYLLRDKEVFSTVRNP
ncbi:MAG: ABC transporter permease subunit [Lachnospiraceae bacterium]|nr:ABC transporter permease subunit [Lachnospiraceae bacterium]